MSLSQTRPTRTQKVPPLGSLRGAFPEETNAPNESDRCLTWTQLRQLGKIRERSSESDGTTTNPPSSASSVNNDWDSASDDAPKDNNESTGKQVDRGPNEKILYDACTIRTWFMMMDTDGDGVVSKDEFVTFLRDRPILPLNEKADSGGTRMAQAVLQRRLIKLFNEIDTNKNKTMEFEEFLTVFRRAGYLLEYTLADNPRDRAAEMLASVPVTSSVSLSSRAQRCRSSLRGSECCWAIEQQERIRSGSFDNDSDRRDSDSTVLESPAAFWEEPVVLGSRRPPWGRHVHGMPRACRETSLRDNVSLDILNASCDSKSTPRGSSLWLRRRSDAAESKG